VISSDEDEEELSFTKDQDSNGQAAAAEGAAVGVRAGGRVRKAPIRSYVESESDGAGDDDDYCASD
jgi:hypothetical protein